MNRQIKITALLLLCVQFTVGCAEMTTKNYRPRKSGTVMYSKGWFLDDKNREKALEMANEFCSPNRAVLMSEDNKKEFTGVSSTQSRMQGDESSGSIVQQKESNVYLHFTCNGGRSTARRN